MVLLKHSHAYELSGDFGVRSDSIWDGACESVFLTHSRVMSILLVYEPQALEQ